MHCTRYSNLYIYVLEPIKYISTGDVISGHAVLALHFVTGAGIFAAVRSVSYYRSDDRIRG